MMQAVEWFGRQVPIAIYRDGTILVYKSGYLRCIDLEGNESCKNRLPMKITDHLKEATRLTARLFRKDIRCSCLLSDDTVFFFKDGKLYSYNRFTNNSKIEYHLPENQSTPLNVIAAKEESNYLILWGEYFSNDNRDEVSILGLTKNGTVDRVYTFPPKTVRHIHNIIEDIYNDGYYVLTGDNDEQAGIYYADIKLQKMIPICIGNQKARAVQGFSISDGLLYATDSVSEQNYIYKLNRKKNWERKEIIPINGSCIYAAKFKEGYVFSTIVESPESAESNKILAMLSTSRGSGILSDEVHLICVDERLNASVIYTAEKDRLPYKLFQYGAITFPAGNTHLCKPIFYAVALKKRDGQMGILKGGDEDDK